MLEKYANQLGLELNRGKRVHFCKMLTDEENTDTLPAVRSGYKYLSLIQQERDTDANFRNIKEKITQKASEILALI